MRRSGSGSTVACAWYLYPAADAAGQERVSLRLNSGQPRGIGLQFRPNERRPSRRGTPFVLHRHIGFLGQAGWSAQSYPCGGSSKMASSRWIVSAWFITTLAASRRTCACAVSRRRSSSQASPASSCARVRSFSMVVTRWSSGFWGLGPRRCSDLIIDPSPPLTVPPRAVDKRLSLVVECRAALDKASSTLPAPPPQVPFPSAEPTVLRQTPLLWLHP